MEANRSRIENSVAQAIQIIADQRIGSSKEDKTIKCIIVKRVNNTDYIVKYNGGTFLASATEDATYLPNADVYVLVPEGDFSKNKKIVGRVSYTTTDDNVSAVATSLNKYSKIGNNLLVQTKTFTTDKNSGFKSSLEDYANPFGLDVRRPLVNQFQQCNILYDNNASIIEDGVITNWYKIRKSTFDAYKNVASAFMLKADFRTSLDKSEIRAATGEYGLILTTTNKNSSFDYDTIQDAWDSLASKSKIIIYDNNEPKAYSLLQYHDLINEYFKCEISTDPNIETVFQKYYKRNFDNNTLIDWEHLDLEKFKQGLELIIDEVSSYKNTVSNHLEEQCITLVNLYHDYLREMLTYTVNYDNQPITIADYPTIYNAWFKESTSSLKSLLTYEYSLNSNIMSGDPYQFSKWSTQYIIQPIDSSLLEDITGLFFYCKNFTPLNEYETNKGKYGNSIFVKNIEFYFLKEADNEVQDYRLELEYPQGAAFVEEQSNIEVKANIWFQDKTDITRQCRIMWFQYDNSITIDSDDYNSWAGSNWRRLSSIDNNVQYAQTTCNFSITDNPVYENKYLCVAIYNAETVLREEFILYNELNYHNVEIQSNSGTVFSYDELFDKTLTCVVDENTLEDSRYKYIWSCNIDGINYILDKDLVKDITNSMTKLEITRINKLKALLGYRAEIQQNETVETFADNVNGNTLIYQCNQIGANDTVIVNCKVVTKDDETFIGTGEITLTVGAPAILKSYQIIIKNADQVFQYSESGIAPTSDRYENPYEPLDLSCEFIGPNGGTVPSSQYKVKWQWPLANTMLQIDYSIAEENPATKASDIYNLSTCPIAIKEDYDYDAVDNQITCLVEYAGAVYRKTTNFTFSKVGDNGTNGTDIVAKISPLSDVEDVNILNDEPLTIMVTTKEDTEHNITHLYKWNTKNALNSPVLKFELYNRNELIDTSEYKNLKWNILGTNSAYESKMNVGRMDAESNSLSAYVSLDLYPEGNNTYYYNYIVQGSAELVVEETAEKTTSQAYYCCYPIPIIERFEQSEVSIPSYSIGIDKKLTMRQVLYNNEGHNPLYNKKQGIKLIFKNFTDNNKRKIVWQAFGGIQDSNQKASALQILDAEGNKVLEYVTYYLPQDIAKAELSNWLEEKTKWETRSQELKTVNSIDINNSVQIQNEDLVQNKVILNPYQYDANMYNFSSSAEEQSLDTEIISDEDSAIDIDVEDENDNPEPASSNIKDFFGEHAEWQQYTDEQKAYLLKAFIEINFKNIQIILDYIESQIQAYTNTENDFIYVIPQDIYSGEYSNNIIKADIYNEKILEYSIYIPIYLSLNTYGLAALNGWDGNSVEIEEDKKYILAPMVGAGSKDKNNKFTGITMGVEKDYSKNETNTGLFGHSHGLRSIFLDAEDGSATFGLPEDDALDKGNPLTEGQIKLVPGGTSTIAKWNFDARSLYRVVSKDETNAVENNSSYLNRIYTNENYGQDSNYTSLVKPYNDAPQNAHGSIPHDQQGILLSANPAYISIKGRPLTESDQGRIKYFGDNTTIRPEDTFELQLDPNDSRLFSIYEHSQRPAGEFKLSTQKTGHAYTYTVSEITYSNGEREINPLSELKFNIQKYINDQYTIEGQSTTNIAPKNTDILIGEKEEVSTEELIGNWIIQNYCNSNSNMSVVAVEKSIETAGENSVIAVFYGIKTLQKVPAIIEWTKTVQKYKKQNNNTEYYYYSYKNPIVKELNKNEIDDSAFSWRRSFKAGIDAEGHFSAEGVNSNSMSMGLDSIRAFKEQSFLPYQGIVFKHGQNSESQDTLVKFFVDRTGDFDAPLYISTSNKLTSNDSSDEGLRPINIYSGQQFNIFTGSHKSSSTPTADITTFQLDHEAQKALLKIAPSGVTATELLLNNNGDNAGHFIHNNDWETKILGKLTTTATDIVTYEFKKAYTQTVTGLVTHNFHGGYTQTVTGTVTHIFNNDYSQTVTGLVTHNFNNGYTQTVSSAATTIKNTSAKGITLQNTDANGTTTGAKLTLTNSVTPRWYLGYSVSTDSTYIKDDGDQELQLYSSKLIRLKSTTTGGTEDQEAGVVIGNKNNNNNQITEVPLTVYGKIFNLALNKAPGNEEHQVDSDLTHWIRRHDWWASQHNHSFSKGVTVHSGIGTDICNPGVGNYAHIYLGIDESQLLNTMSINIQIPQITVTMTEVTVTVNNKPETYYKDPRIKIESSTVSGTITITKNNEGVWTTNNATILNVFPYSRITDLTIQGSYNSGEIKIPDSCKEKSVNIEGVSSAPN